MFLMDDGAGIGWIWRDEMEAKDMKRSASYLPLLCLALPLAACQNLPPAERAQPAAASPGQAFAQASCSGCHAIGRQGISPTSAAPPFAAIANQEGVTADTLSQWLRGAHNYPREMDFYLGEREVDQLVGYMLSLKDPNYRRPPD